MLRAIPIVYSANNTDNNITVVGAPITPIKSKNQFPSIPSVSSNKDTIVATPIKITGNNAVNALTANPGVSSNLNCFASPIEAILPDGSFSNAVGTNFLANTVNKGPAKITVGIAMIKPYNNTSPIFASNCCAITVGPGCGGKNACVTDKAVAIGNPNHKNEIFVCFEI